LEIARANAIASNQLLLVGGDELYNPETLVKGGAAINGLVLSVPWSPRPGDDFTEDSSTLWKGRVSWRTTTAFNAAQGLIAALKGNPTRRGALTALASGQVELTNLQFGPNPIGNIQLMRAVPATKSNNPAIGRPKGSDYQFDPL
jgi:ABC-type branched-subunit amino acid transport system substrate-binding protein